MEENNKPVLPQILLWCVVIAISVLGIVLINHSEETNKNDPYQAYVFSQSLVKEKLKSPKSAKFPWYSDDFIKEKGNVVTVSAYVDAENSFGATIRTKYVATITFKDGEPESGSVRLIE